MIVHCPKCQAPHDCVALRCLETPFREGYNVCYSCSALFVIEPDGTTRVWKRRYQV